MKSLINKIVTAISGVVLFAAAIAMAGLGFAVIASLAFFAICAMGVALLAAPFVQGPKKDDDIVEDAEVSV